MHLLALSTSEPIKSDPSLESIIESLHVASARARGYDPTMPLFGRPSVQDQQREAFWRAWIQRQHPLALASIVLSVFSLTHFGTLWVDESAGIVLGAIVLVQLRKPDAAPREGRLLASIGVLIGVISLVCACMIYFVLPRD